MDREELDLPTKPSDLIFFIHVPKTAGTSFRIAAEMRLEGRVLRDYGPKATDTSDAIMEHVYRHPDKEALARVIAERSIGMICGHVPYETYAHLVVPERVVVFLREPVQRVVSEFHHHQRLYGFAGTLMEFAAQHVQRNKQWNLVRGLNFARAGLVGLSEYYGESLRLLASRTDLELPHFELNTNPKKHGITEYQIPEEEAARLRELNAEDVLLYRSAAQDFGRAVGVSIEFPPDPSDATAAETGPVAPAIPVRGILGGYRDGRVFGWALRPGAARPVLLDVFVGDQLVRTVAANRYRRDLQVTGVHPSGCAGFELELGNVAPGTVIRCRLHGSDQELHKSPLTVEAPSLERP
jgi:hypothetical protein